MPETETYERARGRAEVKYGFFVHAVVYVAVMVLLVVINMLTSPGTIWFIWPLVGWGLAVALHSALVFLFADRDTIVDALTERELRHSQSPPFACLRSLGGGVDCPTSRAVCVHYGRENRVAVHGRLVNAQQHSHCGSEVIYCAHDGLE